MDIQYTQSYLRNKSKTKKIEKITKQHQRIQKQKKTFQKSLPLANTTTQTPRNNGRRRSRWKKMKHLLDIFFGKHTLAYTYIQQKKDTYNGMLSLFSRFFSFFYFIKTQQQPNDDYYCYEIMIIISNNKKVDLSFSIFFLLNMCILSWWTNIC